MGKGAHMVGRRLLPTPNTVFRAACKPLLWSLLALPAFQLPCCEGQNAYPGMSPEWAQAFAWFDQLGFPDAKGCKLVRVATGGWVQGIGKETESLRTEGFLYKTDETGHFSVLTLDLRERSFQRTANGTPAHEEASFEVLPMHQAAAAELADLQAMSDDDYWDWCLERRLTFNKRLSVEGELFVLAWGCARNGHTDIAEKLMTHAKGMVAKKHTFLHTLQSDIGTALMWQAVLACGDAGVPREKLPELFERVVTHFPASEHVERARKTIDLLESMIEEDKRHDAVPTVPLDQLPPEKRVAELIYRLRDQNGQQMGQPGECDIFLTPSQREDTPAHQLVAMGYTAVPQLIEALADKRLTRSIGFHRDFRFSHYVLRVGDCAHSILCQIAGRPFYQRDYTNGYMMRDGEEGTTREQVEKWWQQLKEKGERQFLVDGVASGGEEAWYGARRLASRYPKDAANALIKGIAVSKKGGDLKAYLVYVLGETQGDAVDEVLLDLLAQTPATTVQVAAAVGLHSRGNQAAVPAMIRHWETCQGNSHAASDEQPREDLLVKFLLECGRVSAIKALASGLNSRPLGVREMLLDHIEELARDRRSPEDMTRTATEAWPDVLATPRIFDQIEALLVAMMEDTGRTQGETHSWADDVYTVDPRICDLAADLLSGLRPKTYRFSPMASEKMRDRQRFHCINQWRQRNHLPLRSGPIERPRQRAPEARVSPLLSSFLNARNEEDARSAMEGLANLGLTALPAVLETTQTIGEKHPRAERLAQLARRLSCTVAEVRVPRQMFKPHDEVARAFEKLKGEILTESLLMRCIEQAATLFPRQAKGVSLRIQKDEDLTGILVVLSLTDPHPHVPDTGMGSPFAAGVEFAAWRELVLLNGRPLHSEDGCGIWRNERAEKTGMGSPFPAGVEFAAWRELLLLNGRPLHSEDGHGIWKNERAEKIGTAITKALTAEPTTHFDIRFEWREEMATSNDEFPAIPYE